MRATLKSLATLACVVGLGTAASAQEVTKLLVYGDPVREPIYQAFEDAHEGVEIEMVSVSNEELVAKLQLALRSGSNIPDAVFMADVNFAAQLSTRRVNYLMELSDKVDPAIVNGFFPTANAPCEKGDSLICLRNDVAHFVLWYNKPLMDELGLAVPTTWKEYEEVGLAAAANESGIVVGVAAENIPLMNVLMSNGCDVGIPAADDPETLHINATAPQCVEAAQMVDRMIAAGSLELTGPFDPTFVQKGKDNKVLMIPGPTWFGEYIIKRRFEFTPGSVGVALPPRWGGQDQPVAWSWGGGVWGGWKDTKHPELVVELLEFVTTNEGVARQAVTMPANLAASVPWGEELTASGYYASPQAFDTLVEAAPFGHPGYASLRINSRASFTKAVVNDLANGESFESLLPQLQDEFVNAAKLAGYKVVTD